MRILWDIKIQFAIDDSLGEFEYNLERFRASDKA